MKKTGRKSGDGSDDIAMRNIYPGLRIELRAPARTCGWACIQTGRPGDDK